MNIDPIERTNLTISAGAVAASLALASPGFAASLAVGALLEAWNFRGLRRSAQSFLWGQIRGSGWLGVYSMRMSLLAIGIGAQHSQHGAECRRSLGGSPRWRVGDASRGVDNAIGSA